jgi:nucleoside-diphosphate-sugar epimerase
LHLNKKYKKILIIGSHGYVGSNLIKYYSLDRDLLIYGISRKKGLIKAVKKNYTGDITDKQFLHNIKENFDVIINCAAKTDHFGDEQEFYRQNVEALNQFLTVFDGKYKVFIQISSEAVYLNGKLPILNENTNLPNNNISDYSYSKNLAERAITQFHSRFKNKIIIIRPRIIWGGENSIAFKKLSRAIEKKIFFYVDHGNYMTSSTHIYNLYQGINKAIEFGKNKGQYFILDEFPIRFKHLTEMILGDKIKSPSIPRWLAYVLCNLADTMYYLSFKKVRLPLSRALYFLTFSEVVIDNSLTRKTLHFEPIPYEKLMHEY